MAWKPEPCTDCLERQTSVSNRHAHRSSMHYENGHTYKRAVNDGDHDVDNGDACHVAD